MHIKCTATSAKMEFLHEMERREVALFPTPGKPGATPVEGDPFHHADLCANLASEFLPARPCLLPPRAIPPGR
jgi:hypothetical protein